MIKKDLYNDRILQALKTNGRISNAELAEKIGLSPSACLRRVQELENSGVIKGYRAVFDNEILGIDFIAYVTVGLGEHTKATLLAFEEVLYQHAEVRECHNITGSCEYILRIETANLKAYKSFHTDVLGTIPHVNSLTTHVVMGSPKDDRG
jgi:Lrp/AsnC family leucine-responsive transcriptional regulator